MEYKMPTFVTRYANWKMERIMKREIPIEERNERINKMTRAVALCQRGLMTVDETMEVIANVNKEDKRMLITMYDGSTLACEDLTISYEGGRYVMIVDKYRIVPIEEISEIEAMYKD